MSQITKQDLLDYKEELGSKKRALLSKKDSDIEKANTEIVEFTQEKQAELEKAVATFKDETIAKVLQSYVIESTKIDAQIEAIDRLMEKVESLD